MHAVTGNRGASTGKQLWSKTDLINIEQVMTDYWEPYTKFIPKAKHTQSKAETYTVEGYHSLFRHFLARLRRKSKCYSVNLRKCWSIPSSSL